MSTTTRMRNTKVASEKQILPSAHGSSRTLAQEIEEALRQHPAILDAGVISIPDPEQREQVFAFVALRDGLTASEDELRGLVRSRVVEYKGLEHYVFQTSLPKAPTGEVDRNALKDLASAYPRGFDFFTYNHTYQGVPPHPNEIARRTDGVNTSSTKAAPQEQILTFVLGFWQSRALAVATDLGLPDLLAKGPVYVDELARRTETDASALFRFLRALESIGIFAQTSPRIFSNTPMSESLRKNVPGSQWPTVVHCLSKGSGPFEGWDELEYAVRTGGPSVEKTYGYDFWELLQRSPQASAALNGAMRSANLAMTPAVTAAYQWSQFPVIADIGGGIGAQLVSILDASPTSKGILFDKPHLRAESISHDRVEVIDGDFFESVPAGADAYLLRWVLHDWDDAEAALILGSIRRAMSANARLIVVEPLIPDGPAFHFGKWTDLQMLVCLGGRERTEPEYRALISGAGFNLQEVVATASPLSLLVAKPV